MLYVSLAWRNIWRNKRRTLISIASVLFAVLFALLTRSMQLGSYAYMIRNVVRLSTGYLQIHAEGFWEKRSIDLAFRDGADLREHLAGVSHVTQLIPRLQTFALAASATGTRGVMVNGIDPAAENTMNGLGAKVIRGVYLESGDTAVLLGEALASTLGLGAGRYAHPVRTGLPRRHRSRDAPGPGNRPIPQPRDEFLLCLPPPFRRTGALRHAGHDQLAERDAGPSAVSAGVAGRDPCGGRTGIRSHGVAGDDARSGAGNRG